MTKCFGPEFKSQAIDYALANSHQPLVSIAVKLGVSYLTSDKWFRTANPEGSSKRIESDDILQMVGIDKNTVLS